MRCALAPFRMPLARPTQACPERTTELEKHKWTKH
jgi:hypothetical protein